MCSFNSKRISSRLRKFQRGALESLIGFGPFIASCKSYDDAEGRWEGIFAEASTENSCATLFLHIIDEKKI